MNKPTLSALAAVALFFTGLSMSVMTYPRLVLGFLDLFGDFDPTLLFVLGGAVATTMLLFRIVLRRGRPLLADAFRLSPLKQVDRRLLGGAAIFGIGWGLAGYCPGPALAGLGVGSIEALWFVPAMVAGLLLHRWASRG